MTTDTLATPGTNRLLALEQAMARFAAPDALVRMGAAVLRAPVPARNDGSLGLFRSLGFTPWMRVLERTPDGER